MTEPDVTLTDFALALESAIFVAILWRSGGPSKQLRFWLLLYFAAASVASLCGGLVHGYFLEPGTFGRAILWPAALLAIGVNALAAWGIGAMLLFSHQMMQRIVGLVLLAVAIYSAIVLFADETFLVAIAMALPAALFLLVALAVAHWRDHRPGALLAAAGVATTLAAALVQQLGVGAHPVYFNHNATAHVVEAVALGLVFAGGLRLMDSTVDESKRSVACLHDASF